MARQDKCVNKTNFAQLYEQMTRELDMFPETYTIKNLSVPTYVNNLNILTSTSLEQTAFNMNDIFLPHWDPAKHPRSFDLHPR